MGKTTKKEIQEPKGSAAHMDLAATQGTTKPEDITLAEELAGEEPVYRV